MLSTRWKQSESFQFLWKWRVNSSFHCTLVNRRKSWAMMKEFNFEKVYRTNAEWILLRRRGTSGTELITNINLMRRIYKRCKFICKVFAQLRRFHATLKLSLPTLFAKSNSTREQRAFSFSPVYNIKKLNN